jgi:hypothetical protein
MFDDENYKFNTNKKNNTSYFSEKHYELHNKEIIEKLFKLFKDYLTHIKRNIKTDKYKNIVLLPFNVNYTSEFNKTLKQKVNANVDTVGSMIRFMPLFDYTKDMTFIINGNYSLAPIFLKHINDFIISNKIVFFSPNLYNFMPLEQDQQNTYMYFKDKFPQLSSSIRFLGGLFGIKNKLFSTFNGKEFLPVRSFLTGVNKYTNDITDIKKTIESEKARFITIIKRDYNKFINKKNAKKNNQPVDSLATLNYDINKLIETFLDSLDDIRKTVDKENYKYGFEYGIDEIFLSYMFSPFNDIFIKSNKLIDYKFNITSFITDNIRGEILNTSIEKVNDAIKAYNEKEDSQKLEPITDISSISIYCMFLLKYIINQKNKEIKEQITGYHPVKNEIFLLGKNIDDIITHNIGLLSLDLDDYYVDNNLLKINRTNVNKLMLCYQLNNDSKPMSFIELSNNADIEEILNFFQRNKIFANYFLSRDLFSIESCNMPSTKMTKINNKNNKNKMNINQPKTKKNNNMKNIDKCKGINFVINKLKTDVSIFKLIQAFDMPKTIILHGGEVDENNLFYKHSKYFKIYDIFNVKMEEILSYITENILDRPYEI